MLSPFELLRVFGSAVSRGGAPVESAGPEGGFGLEYPLRSGNVLVMYGSFALTAWMVWQGWKRDWHDWHWGWALYGLGVGGLFLLIRLRRLRVDERGLSLQYAISPDKLIRWEEISHFERYRMQSGAKDIYFFRSRPNPATGKEVTIAVSEMSYDLPGVVQELRKRVELPEWPRRKRHWWGG